MKLSGTYKLAAVVTIITITTTISTNTSIGW